MIAWAYRHGIHEVFFTPKDVREKLTRWPQDYTLARPHNALAGSYACILRGRLVRATRIIQESHEQLEPLT
jgi:hypothetical protein